MKLVNFAPKGGSDFRPGIVMGQKIIDLPAFWKVFFKETPFPFNTVSDLLTADSESWERVNKVYLWMESKILRDKLNEATFLAPITHPQSLRDFYAFEQHVVTAYANRNQEVPKEWYEIPVFYFSNHNAIFGPNDTIPYPRLSNALDYELEVACVIGMQGQDIPADQALDYIFGFTIMNDWSARDIQRQEMKVGLGPAKGKDFATSLGPWLVTPDELADRAIPGKPGVYDLEMVARVNGVERSRGNWKDLYYSFGEMIARASEGVMLRPGDVIGSGTVGTGCLLELTKGQGPWLQPGDVVELEIERLGILRNTIGDKKVESRK